MIFLDKIINTFISRKGPECVTFEDAIKMAGSMGQISGVPKTIQVNKKRPQILDWLSGSLETKVSDWFGELPAYRWRME